MENQHLEPEPSYDITMIREISRGNEAFIRKMLGIFVEQTPMHINEMREHYAQSDWKRMGELAHKIKPTIDNLGIQAIKSAVREMEVIGKCGEGTERMGNLLEKIVLVLNQAVNAIRADYQMN
jgi:HPt (histidine-containing phosphotransfer) domain-containing protein